MKQAIKLCVGVFALTAYFGLQSMELTSPAFAHEETIPLAYTCQGDNTSPPLSWKGVPPGTKSLAITLEDPDAPGGLFIHWVVYQIPPESEGLPSNIPPTMSLANGALQGTNSFHKIGYGGPCPPSGARHRYFFTLYALDTIPDTPSFATYDQLQRSMEGHVIEKAELMGFFK
jgi:Raf kinase inhibitor-like YbhB/YbcL family protein